jgi:hypothetical protein
MPCLASILQVEHAEVKGAKIRNCGEEVMTRGQPHKSPSSRDSQGAELGDGRSVEPKSH